jgi:hypothetical protein
MFYFKFVLINPRLACRIIVIMKAFPSTLSRPSAILRRIAVLLAALVWGGPALGTMSRAPLSS